MNEENQNAVYTGLSNHIETAFTIFFSIFILLGVISFLHLMNAARFNNFDDRLWAWLVLFLSLALACCCYAAKMVFKLWIEAGIRNSAAKKQVQ